MLSKIILQYANVGLNLKTNWCKIKENLKLTYIGVYALTVLQSGTQNPKFEIWVLYPIDYLPTCYFFKLK
jgi:hypothetical protein